MRCPKCNFISFDDLVACAKCANDISVLSKELNGTCIESKPEFFLGTAIQTPAIDDDAFSDSQVLPPIDQGGVNFDDTSTGGFSQLASSSSQTSSVDFDDSIGLAAEDDVAIELGEIMPIDLDQLDDTSVFAGGGLTETHNLNDSDLSSDLDKTEAMSVSSAINLDLDLDGDFSDIDIDDSALDFSNESVSSIGSAGSSDYNSSRSNDMSGLGGASADGSGSLELDDELIAQLNSSDDELDATTAFAPDFVKQDQPSVFASGSQGEVAASLELDDSLIAELAGDSDHGGVSEGFSLDFSSDHSGSGEFELDEALLAELASDSGTGEHPADSAVGLPVIGSGLSEFEGDFVVDSKPASIEDLTGEFEPIASTEELGFDELNLSDIDVSDLVESSTEEGVVADDTLKDGSVSFGGSLPSSQSFEPFVADFSADATDLLGEDAANVPFEDLTGEFPPLAPGDESDVAALGLADIDVSDLILASEEEISLATEFPSNDGDVAPVSSGTDFLSVDDTIYDALPVVDETAGLRAGADLGLDPSHASNLDSGIDLEGFFDAPGTLSDIDDSALDGMLDGASKIGPDDLPEIELLLDDDDDGPPDLP